MTCEIVNVTDTPFNCLFDGYLDVNTELQLGLMVSLMVAVPLYAKYEDPVIPAVGLLLVGGEGEVRLEGGKALVTTAGFAPQLCKVVHETEHTLPGALGEGELCDRDPEATEEVSPEKRQRIPIGLDGVRTPATLVGEVEL